MARGEAAVEAEKQVAAAALEAMAQETQAVQDKVGC